MSDRKLLTPDAEALLAMKTSELLLFVRDDLEKLAITNNPSIRFHLGTFFDVQPNKNCFVCAAGAVAYQSFHCRSNKQFEEMCGNTSNYQKWGSPFGKLASRISDVVMLQSAPVSIIERFVGAKDNAYHSLHACIPYLTNLSAAFAEIGD